MSKLTELADACNSGACNVSGLLLSLGEAVKEYNETHKQGAPAFLRNEASLKCIIGQISFLLGESAGPTESALAAYLEQQEGVK